MIMARATNKPRQWGILLLFVSVPTLICCALPILLISLGFGATVASLYSEQLPFLQWFGLNSAIIFIISGSILGIKTNVSSRPRISQCLQKSTQMECLFLVRCKPSMGSRRFHNICLTFFNSVSKLQHD